MVKLTYVGNVLKLLLRRWVRAEQKVEKTAQFLSRIKPQVVR